MQIFINNFMNYLTNYYRNLSEQLQERVNILEGELQKLATETKPEPKLKLEPKPIPEPKEKEFVPVPVPGRSFPGEKRPTLPGEKPSELSNLFMDIKPKNINSEPSEKIKIQKQKDQLIGKKKKPAFEPENRPYIT
jgi:hypothetical protein